MNKLIFGFAYFVLIAFVDFRIITPLILHEDACHYHNTYTPLWVEWLYINGASNGHPDGSITHLVLLILVSWFLAHKTSDRIVRFIEGLPPKWPFQKL